MQKGWIKLHRKVLDNPLFKFPNYTLVWMYLLLNATHSECDVLFEGKRITLKPGQLTCGASQIAKQMGVTRSSVERALGRFKVEDMVEVQASNKCSLITVKNWASYQDTEEVVEEQTRNKRGASEEQVRTKQECNNEKNVRMKEPESEATIVARTPKDDAKDFFEKLEYQERVVSMLTDRGVDEQTAREEVVKFVSYWTELNKSGTKQRWQMEKVFEVRRRLVTWFGKVKMQNKGFNQTKTFVI